MCKLKTAKITRWKAVTGDWHAPISGRASEPRRVILTEDMFAPSVTDERIALVMASMASRNMHTFEITTAYADRVKRWFAQASRQGKKALAAHRRYVRKHHKQHCHMYDGRYGQSVTPPPTAELRYVYDVAGEAELRGRREDCKDGLSEHPHYYGGFSEGEFCWQGWPLPHIVIRSPGGRCVATGVRYHKPSPL